MIKLDGNFLEGGGQIVRNALALSVLTGKAFEICDIRKNRPQPGLKAQHLHAIKALEELCGAKTSGAELGSERLIFEPGKINTKNLEIDIGTAGSISLLLQAVLLPCFFADKQITLKIKGGTAVKWAMPIEYLQNVFVPQIRKFCEKIEVKLEKRGYYPAGGGIVEIVIKPKYKLSEFDSFEKFSDFLKTKQKIKLFNRGKLICIGGVSHASKELEKSQVTERQTIRAKNILASLKVPIEISCEYSEALSISSGITLWAMFENKDDDDSQIILGSDILGERGKKSEAVADECANQLLKDINSKACVDKHLADNLIPWMALFKPSRIKTSEITNHTKTNIYVTEMFLGKCFEVEGDLVGSK